MKRKILLLPLAVMGVAIYAQSWQVKAQAYKAYVQSFLDQSVEQSNGSLRITTEGLSVSGFPFSHKVEMTHSSLIGEGNGEHLEVHSHHISFTPTSQNARIDYDVTWEEPVKVIYSKGEEKRTYKVHQQKPFPVALTTGVVGKMPQPLSMVDKVRVKLPKDIYLTAKCGEAEQVIHFDFPLANAPIEVDIPKNLYHPLQTFVYMMDEAIKGQGKCSDRLKAHNHQH